MSIQTLDLFGGSAKGKNQLGSRLVCATRDRLESAVYQALCYRNAAKVDFATFCLKSTSAFVTLTAEEQRRFQTVELVRTLSTEMGSEDYEQFSNVFQMLNETGEDFTSFLDRCTLTDMLPHQTQTADEMRQMIPYYLCRFPDGEYAWDVWHYLAAFGLSLDDTKVPNKFKLCINDQLSAACVDNVAAAAADKLIASSCVSPEDFSGYQGRCLSNWSGMSHIQNLMFIAECDLFPEEENRIRFENVNFGHGGNTKLYQVEYTLHAVSILSDQKHKCVGGLFREHELDTLAPYVMRLVELGFPAEVIRAR